MAEASTARRVDATKSAYVSLACSEGEASTDAMMVSAATDPQHTARNLALGFIAGVLAVAIFHQGMVFLLSAIGMIHGSVYATRPVPPFEVPVILDQMFWGGVWGIVYAAIADRLPQAWPRLLTGFLFGAIGPVLVAWFVVAPLKGQAVMAGGDLNRMAAGILINGAFGVGVALIYPWLHDAIERRQMPHTTSR
jgi:hypothetical protein